MKVTLVSVTKDMDKICGLAAATCTASKNPHKALRHAIESGHESVLEHGHFTFLLEGVSRVTMAQLTRHRIASYSIKSQRYCEIGSDDLVIPKSLEDTWLADRVDELMKEVMNLYQELLDVGVPAEDARYIVPQGTTTDLVVTMNARELRHLFHLRCCNRAQWEIREMADEMFRICNEQQPEIFAKAGPGCVDGRCPELIPCGHPRNKNEWEC